MQSKAPLLDLKGISKIYAPTLESSVHALVDIDLAVAHGDFATITGKSGSGKSTLASIMGCLDAPSSGRCEFEGQDVAQMTEAGRSGLRLKHIGFVFQGFQLMPHLTAVENVMLPLEYGRVPARDRRALAMAALERCGIAERAHHRPMELSGGQQQRVAIARAVVAQPRLIIADEPTGALDTDSADQVLKLLTEINRAGAALLIVTHDMAIADLAPRRIHLQNGRILQGNSQ